MRNLAQMCVLAAMILTGCGGKDAKDQPATAAVAADTVAATVDTAAVAGDTVADTMGACLPCPPVHPNWVYVPGENLEYKTKSSQLLSFKNITKIELVRMVMQKVAEGGGVIINYAPDSLQKKSILKKEMNRHFLNDINRMALVTIKREMLICCEINLYERENIIATFKTNGHDFYDEEKHLLYEYQYVGDEMNYTDLLYKYWGIEGYGKYIWVK